MQPIPSAPPPPPPVLSTSSGQAIVVEGHTGGPDDIADELPAAQYQSREFPWLQAGVLLVVLMLAAWAGLWLRRRRRLPPTYATPEAQARVRLAGVEAGIGTGDARAFYAELSAILTQYVEARLALRSTRLTSVEIRREFRRNGVMSAEWQTALGGFFDECDRAKFAPPGAVLPGPEAVARCRRLIDQLAAKADAAPRLANPWEGWSNASV
jgi:hypothetical protein